MKLDITKAHWAYYVIGGTLHLYRVTGIQPPTLNEKKCRLHLDSYTIQFTHVKGAMFEGSAKRTDGKPFYVFVGNAKLAWEQYKKELLAERGFIVGEVTRTKFELSKIDEKIKQVNARLK
jgi:hypothetical protein